MPLSIREILAAADLDPTGAVKWGHRTLPDRPGVYCVSWSSDPDTTSVAKAKYEPSPLAYADLTSACPTISIDGKTAASSAVVERIGSFWLPNEPILYIGLAGTSLRTRVGQYYSTRLGARGPHAGGWWLKTLDDLDQLYVHFASCDDVSTREQSMLDAFASSVDPVTQSQLFDTERVAPFANVEVAKGRYKRHGLSNYKVPAQVVASIPAVNADDPIVTMPIIVDVPVTELKVQSQQVTDKDRTRSYLRIPAASKHAFPDSGAQVKVDLDGVVIDVPWRPNGTRSGTLGVGLEYMCGLRERNERLEINLFDGIYTIVRK